MYYFLDIEHPKEGPVRLILQHVDSGVESFIDVDSNTGYERQNFLSWVAEGNTPEPYVLEEE